MEQVKFEKIKNALESRFIIVQTSALKIIGYGWVAGDFSDEQLAELNEILRQKKLKARGAAT